jgi:hypothetical protein
VAGWSLPSLIHKSGIEPTPNTSYRNKLPTSVIPRGLAAGQFISAQEIFCIVVNHSQQDIDSHSTFQGAMQKLPRSKLQGSNLVFAVNSKKIKVKDQVFLSKKHILTFAKPRLIIKLNANHKHLRSYAVDRQTAPARLTRRRRRRKREMFSKKAQKHMKNREDY